MTEGQSLRGQRYPSPQFGDIQTSAPFSADQLKIRRSWQGPPPPSGLPVCMYVPIYRISIDGTVVYIYESSVIIGIKITNNYYCPLSGFELSGRLRRPRAVQTVWDQWSQTNYPFGQSDSLRRFAVPVLSSPVDNLLISVYLAP